jgi:hypothetical protein
MIIISLTSTVLLSQFLSLRSSVWNINAIKFLLAAAQPPLFEQQILVRRLNFGVFLCRRKKKKPEQLVVHMN